MVACYLRQWLRGFATSLSQAHRPQKYCRLQLEDLADRVMPSILFGNTPGLTVSDNNGPVLSSAQVRVVFWGTGWNSSGGLALRGQVINSINSLTAPSGTYFASTAPGADLGQYRPGGTGSRPVIDNFFATSNFSPGATFTANDVLNMLRNTSPFNTQPNFYYYVIPDPSSDPSPSCGCAAEHTFGTIGSTTTHFGFSRNLPLGTAGQLDDLTILYSHEMVESITDPEGTALQVNPRNPNAWNEIADNEAQLYGYRLNGVWTQAYWSRSDGKFTVPTGQSQHFFVSGGLIPRVLTVNGDQLANHNDSITVDANGSDVRVTLNGEVAQFEPGQISSIVVNTQTGNDTVNVERTLAGIPVTVNLGGGTDIVNVSASARNLGNIQGAVTIHDGAGVDTLNVDDQANAAGATYTMTAGIVQRSGSALINYNSGINFVNINGGSGNNTYNVNGTEEIYATAINTGNGVDTVNVRATGDGGFSAGGPLTVTTTGSGSNRNTVNVGNAGSLAGITSAVTFNNTPSYDHLVLDDSSDATNRAVHVTANSITGFSTGSINWTSPGGISSFDSIVIKGGTGTNTYTVNAPQAYIGTTLDTGSGADTINVQATSAPLTIDTLSGTALVSSTVTVDSAGIGAALTIHNNPSRDTVIINDDTDSTNRTVTIGSNGITGLSAYPISFTNYSVSDLTVNGGTGTNSYTITDTPAASGMTLNTGTGDDVVNVQGLASPLVVNGQGGTNTINVGSPSNTLDTLQAALTVTDVSGTATLVVDDSAFGDYETYAITDATVTAGRLPNFVLSYAGIAALSLNTGSGGDTVTLTNAANTLDGIGNVSVNDASGTATVVVDDSAFGDYETYAITDATVTAGRLPGFVLSYAGIAALALNTGFGSDTVTLTNAGNTLDGIGNVRVNDASGTATLVVDDSGLGSNESYAIIDPTVSVARLPNFLLTYSGIAALNLYTGPGSDTFDIDSTSVSTAVTAGAGGNIFHISPFSQYLASIAGPLTLNGGGSDILEFFDANDPGAETFSFDSVPSTLTLGSTGGTIASFAGMGGGVYVMTNGFSTPDDQSGTVIFDPAGGPPSGSPSIPGRHETPFGDRAEAQVAIDRAHVVRMADGETASRPHAQVADFFRHAAGTSPDPWAFLDLVPA